MRGGDSTSGKSACVYCVGWLALVASEGGKVNEKRGGGGEIGTRETRSGGGVEQYVTHEVEKWHKKYDWKYTSGMRTGKKQHR